MIVLIDIPLTELKREPKKGLEKFFLKVASIGEDGRHIVFLPRKEADWIVNEFGFTPMQRKYIKRLNRNFFQYKSMMKNSKSILRICRKGELKVESNGNKITWSIGYKNIIEGNYLDFPILLVENRLTDGEFYKLVFKQIMKKDRKIFGKSIQPYLKFENGAGSQIVGMFEALVNEKRVVICVCDKDMKVPGGEVSPYYKSIVEMEKNNASIGKVMATPGRSVENFLSLELILDILNNPNYNSKGEIKNHKNASDAIQNLIQFRDGQKDVGQGECLLLYFHIKKGIKYNEEAENQNISGEREWLMDKYGLTSMEVKSFQIEGIGSRLNVVRKLLSRDDREERISSLIEGGYWKLHFSDWFDPIIWYYCGSRKQRT